MGRGADRRARGFHAGQRDRVAPATCPTSARRCRWRRPSGWRPCAARPRRAATSGGATCAWTARCSRSSARPACGSTAAAWPRACSPTSRPTCSRTTTASPSTAAATSGSAAASGVPRLVDVASPFGDRVLHRYELADGGVATSGIGRRSWIDPNGAPAHHLLDPGSGRPAFTGMVQATALAPDAVAAETLAKAAVLSGPDAARRWLPHGGVLVLEDGTHEADRGAAMSTLATSAGPHLFWITSRAAGSAALLLSSAGVCLGLLMGGRLAKRRTYDLRVLHEALSLATMVAIAVHALSLLGDTSCTPSLIDVTDAVRQRLQDLLDEHGHHRRLGDRCARPLLLRARQDRRRTLAAPASLHRARLDPRPDPLAGRGHRRGHAAGSWR